MPKNTIITADTLKSFKELPKRKRAFIEAFVRYGDEVKAFEEAGYLATRTLKARARKLRLQLAPQIDVALSNYVQSTHMAILSIRVIRDLAENAESEGIKLQAAKELLTRGGWDQAKEVNVNHTVKHLSNDEVDERIHELQRELTQDLPRIEH